MEIQYFRDRRSLRAILQLLVAGSILVISLGVFHLADSSQVRFSAERWESIRSRSDYGLRYRMHEDRLVTLRHQPRLHRDDILQMLGDANRSNPDKTILRYDLGSRRISLLPVGRYHLRLLLDNGENVVSVHVAPE